MFVSRMEVLESTLRVPEWRLEGYGHTHGFVFSVDEMVRVGNPGYAAVSTERLIYSKFLWNRDLCADIVVWAQTLTLIIRRGSFR